MLQRMESSAEIESSTRINPFESSESIQEFPNFTTQILSRVLHYMEYLPTWKP